ncbi:MAG: aliphatic sulfonate ABC transporter substrate-binding protein [Nocardioides sp.]|uniref:aliphatic sulfonate ABC transporter substrate-binding protein n=1 Tax=Nocardioides sp. TaxID=35761 RepID=UPI0039E22246
MKSPFAHRWIALAVAATTALALTACGGSDGGSASGGSGDIKVTIGYIGDFNGTSLIAVADAEGLWAEHGIEVEEKVFTDGPTQITALDAGDLDFGYIGPGAFWLPASGHGKIIALNSLGGADRVVAQPGITSLAQLKGKKIGVPQGTSGDMILGLALEKAGLSRSEVNIVPMDPETIVTAFDSGQIDAAGLWYPMLDNVKKKVPDLVELAQDSDFSDSFSFPTAIVAGNDVVEDDPDTVAKVDQVLREAMDWRSAHLDEAVSQVAEKTKQSEDSVQADADRNRMLTSAQADKVTQNGTAEKWLEALGDYFVDNDELDSNPDPADYYLGDDFVAAGKD